MKVLPLFYTLLVLLSSTLFIKAQSVAIPDATFRAYLEIKYPSSMEDGNLYYTTYEITHTTTLNLDEAGSAIQDLTGIEYFSGLTELICENKQLSQFSNLPASLTSLYFSGNLFTVFPTNLPAGLLNLDCSYNQLTNLTGIPNSVTYLACTNNPLTALTLPSSLSILLCTSTGISSLPALPPATVTILADSNQLMNLPVLPASLKILHASHNQLTSLPSIPSSLSSLNVSHNQLSSLPTLPAKLRILDCSVNSLTTLGSSLPDSLTNLRCDSNQITQIPSLPETLIILECSYNQLTSLPPVHDLYMLNCAYNQISMLPELEGYTISNLYCSNNNISCLPYLPNTIQTLLVANNLFACIPNLPTGLTYPPDITTICDQTDPAAACTYPRIKGTVYLDANGNNVQDNGEKGLAYAKLQFQPGNYIVLADSTGNYNVPVDVRNYTITIYTASYPYYSFAPALQTASFTAYGQTDDQNNFAAQFLNASANDLMVSITPLGKRIRANFITQYTITYTNKGSTLLNGSASLNYDAAFDYIDASPDLTSHVDNVLNWDFNNLYPGQTKNILVTFKIPANAVIDDTYDFTATVNPISGDETPSDNQDVLIQTVTGSLDPNYKEVTPAGDISPAEVTAQDPFTYVVHFQNTGNAEALVVTVKDTISTNFDIENIETLAASHPYTFNMNNGSALWIFDDIHLPDSTSDEVHSHGFVKYRIIPKNTLQVNDEIKNTAHIFFDYNTPVSTNTTLNRVSMPTSIQDEVTNESMNLYPNPSNGTCYLVCNEQGQGQLKITTAEGKIIYTQTVTNLSETQQINLQALPKGLYIVQVIAGQKVMTNKLILN